MLYEISFGLETHPENFKMKDYTVKISDVLWMFQGTSIGFQYFLCIYQWFLSSGTGQSG